MEENKDNQLGGKSIGYKVKEELSQEAKNILKKLNNQGRLINYKKPNFTAGNRKEYNFTNFSSLGELFKRVYYREILMPGAEREQDEFNESLKLLKEYKPRDTEFLKEGKNF